MLNPVNKIKTSTSNWAVKKRCLLWLFGWAYTYSLGAVECRDDDSPENPVNWRPTLWVFIMARLYHDWPKLNMASVKNVKNILWQFHKMFFHGCLYVILCLQLIWHIREAAMYVCILGKIIRECYLSWSVSDHLKSKNAHSEASKNKALSTWSYFQTAVSDPYSNRFLFASKLLFS